MKLTLIVSALLLAAAPALADRSGRECQGDLVREAWQYSNFEFLAAQKDGLPEIKACKNVDYRDDSIDLRIDSKVYITDDGRSLIVQDNLKKTLNVARIPGKVRDFVVMAGRLVISTVDHKVLVVARNGSVLEMLTAAGESYDQVTDIGMDSRGEDLVLHQETLPTVHLSERQVTNRINSAGNYRVISLF